MVLKEVLLTYGSVHLARALDYGLDYLDKALKREGAPILKRPSTLVGLLGFGVGAPLAVAFLGRRIPEDIQYMLLLIGAVESTRVWDVISEATAGAQVARFVPAQVPATRPVPRRAPAPAPAEEIPSGLF